MQPIEVVFCGNSVYLWVLASALQPIDQLRISCLDHPLRHAMRDINMICPDVVIYEAREDADDMVKRLLHDDPGLLVIGIHLETDLLENVWTGRKWTSALEDLPRVIQACKEIKSRLISGVL